MGATPKPREGDQFSEQETQQRFERLVRAALNTKPKPRKSMGWKGVPAQSKKRQRQKRT
jgi:spore germination protein GerM